MSNGAPLPDDPVGPTESEETTSTIPATEAEGALTPRDWGSKAWKRPFLAALARTGNAAAAARHVGRSYTYVQDERTDDPEFGKAWLEAKAVHADLLDQIAWRRGTVGEPRRTTTTRTTRVRNPATGQMETTDEAVTVVEATRVSDRMLEMQLRAAKPEKYGDRVEHTIHGGDPIQIEVGPRMRSDERALALLELMVEAGAIEPDALPLPREGDGA